ncbi:aminotransferase class IV [Flavobacteriaceae bacterium]|nr:aminotransferase class IV [Flavobacteriaceae bacterium]
MTKISFLNGEFKPYEQCFVHAEDRGLQFADAVYEVILLHEKKLIDDEKHLQRLFFSLGELGIKIEYNIDNIKKIIRQICDLNEVENGAIYLQVSRGHSGPRSQNIPIKYKASIFIKISSLIKSSKDIYSLKTFDDLRWGRCDIKSTALIYSSICRTKAIENNFDDALFIKNNFITECSFANIFFINTDNDLITREVDREILNGVTRRRVIDLMQEIDITVIEKKFSLSDLTKAKEVFVTSSTLKIRPIGKINDIIIGGGKVGILTRKIQNLYQEFILK